MTIQTIDHLDQWPFGLLTIRIIDNSKQYPRVPSRGSFLPVVSYPHQNHMDPHFFRPWVQWTHCIDLNQAGSNFIYWHREVPGQLATTLQQRSLYSIWTALLPSAGVCGLGIRTDSTNHSQRTTHFHKKVIIWENETSHQQHNEFICQTKTWHCWGRVEKNIFVQLIAKLKWFSDYWHLFALTCTAL